ncbi:hypothetical protein HMPREF1219_02204 [Corynebacterium pyruviciproducens ATCC BAA-1742]|uniref:CoA-substrate-specific enzyme activase n=1 Tax=Corynebacterium pyruviciproducens ATCC BAA-1742 TaxID=1125779 RepID=S2YTX6_9CORY|nr:acyl-CoA dehydratase activase-related protein [Corynebacterium pyruviciproducens]EPD67791.1 hypothetical protein HMPREF1219_02204 [Corynebacterium pyruviciproducens ATCC BAA-1742]
MARNDGLMRLGIDVGSTTVKAVLLRPDGSHAFEDYRRHNADVRRELLKLVRDIETEFPEVRTAVAVTGSGGLSIAEHIGATFVQEVIAETEATERTYPEADVIIELGGEDAKLTYLKPTPEQRMNGSCAGGTGAFIDQMATLLKTDAAGLNALAEKSTQLYPIASRCGVFAKSDIQPLINQGVPHEDLAASVFQSVATQTVAGLANGRPIRGTVLFLGGPLHFLSELREAYRRILERVDNFITPDSGQLYVAYGAALLAEHGTEQPLGQIADKLANAGNIGETTRRLEPLFKDKADYEAFLARHEKAHVDQVELDPLTAAGKTYYLGIDAGSTTIKAVLIDEDNTIVFSHYASNEGDPIAAATAIVTHLRDVLPPTATIARSCSTGYGESLVQTALGVDEGEIETMAHYRAAEYLAPGVTSVIDIGGQDMKFLKIKNGTVDSISVNEACSSGCGSFLQTFAHSMGTDVEQFAEAAVTAASPVDLGTRCTVFMNSSVKQAQKDGADVGDISAGLSYSVVRNALYKVMKLRSADELGDTVVVQGGTFLNDAVLRAFEKLSGREVVRPNIAGLMGAYGAALTAKKHAEAGAESGLLGTEEISALTVETSRKTCRLCQNHCTMTISTFSTGERHVSGNRCERGASLERVPKKSPIPNMYDWKYKRTFGYRRLTEKKATRGDIGIPRVLNMYEDYPFWFTVLSALKFRVMVSTRSNHELFEQGMDTIPSENVCYPAKLVHGHIDNLLDKGVKTIFYPCVTFNDDSVKGQDNTFNCPIVATYPEVIRNNMARLTEDKARFISPFLSLHNKEKLPARLAEVFADWGVTVEEARAACEAGWEEEAAYHEDIRAKGREALEYVREHGIRGIVLAGRPYHLDPEINHGIPKVIQGLGHAVLTEDCLPQGHLDRPLRVRDQWAFHSRLYEAAGTVSGTPELELVQLISFGCGLDAVTADQVQEILEGEGEVYTSLKIDEVSNLGAAKIRLRSLVAAVEERSTASASVDTAKVLGEVGEETYRAYGHVQAKVPYTEEMQKQGYEILMPQLAPIHMRLFAPVLRAAGYNVRLLEKASDDDIEVGLKYVNNDACYPAIVVIGQLISQFLAGTADPDRTAVGITQTGGQCRATNYAGLLRKGLIDAGYPQVPVIALSVQGFESNPGFKVTPTMLHRVFQAVTVGDVLQKVLLRTRPYQIDGNVNRLYEKWNTISREWFGNDRYSATLGRRVGFGALIRAIVADFDTVELQDIPRKPRVGLVGEILVQFHPDANNHAVATIEKEGCEAELPSLAQFFHMGLVSSDFKTEVLGSMTPNQHRLTKFALWGMQQYEKVACKAIARSTRFENGPLIQELAEKVQDVASLGNIAGEGWYLTADMMDMIENGCPNIICAQPFACLPNHVIGKGMFRALRLKYPQANIVGIDYDAGASEVNQLNRIKLMIATAKKQHEFALRQPTKAGESSSSPRSGCGCGPVAAQATGTRVPVTLGMPAVR